MWQGDYELYGEQFADDAVVTEIGLGLDRRIASREALEAMAKDSSTNQKPRLFVHNHVVDLLSEDRAIGYAYVEVLDGLADYEKQAVGHYKDEYVKLDGTWKLARRDLTFVWARQEFIDRLNALD